LVTFGPSRGELYRHDHVFRVIDRPSRLVVDATEHRPDGSIVEFENAAPLHECRRIDRPPIARVRRLAWTGSAAPTLDPAD
jgi:hypothetical protein